MLRGFSYDKIKEFNFMIERYLDEVYNILIINYWL